MYVIDAEDMQQNVLT